MRFSKWYRLAQLDLIPKRSGLFQVRQVKGLINYPRGKSAMYIYGWADQDLRASLGDCLFQLEIDAYLGRYSLDEYKLDWSSEYRRLFDGFVDRFGAEPLGNSSGAIPTGRSSQRS